MRTALLVGIALVVGVVALEFATEPAAARVCTKVGICLPEGLSCDPTALADCPPSGGGGYGCDPSGDTCNPCDPTPGLPPRGC